MRRIDGGRSEKTVELKGRSARYLRLTPLAGRSDHFSANELMLNKKDNTAGKPLGSLVGKETVCDEDYVHLKGNALGIEQGDASWDSHVAGRGADFNMNGAYDAYDIWITMSKLNSGTKKTDKVSGGIALIPNKSEVKRGEVVTFDVYADDARAVNALGALVHYDTAKFKVVDGSVPQCRHFSHGELQHGETPRLGEPDACQQGRSGPVQRVRRRY